MRIIIFCFLIGLFLFSGCVYTQREDCSSCSNSRYVANVDDSDYDCSGPVTLEGRGNLAFAFEEEGDSALLGISDLTCLTQLNFSAVTVVTSTGSYKIAYEKLSDISALQNLTNLEDLTLIKTNVSDLSPLKELKNLKTLNLSGTNVSDIEPLSELNLENLNLNYTNVQNLSPLKKIKTLQRLHLYEVLLSRSQLNILKELKNLEFLTVHENISHAECQELKNALPKTTIYKSYPEEC